MRILIVALAITFGGGSAAAQNPRSENDLRRGKFFSRPITQLELILVNLKAAAERVAKLYFTRDQKFRVLRDAPEPQGDAAFISASGRVALGLTLYVSEMADPWKEVCDAAIRQFYGWFYFPPKEGLDADTRLRMMEKYFGEAVRLDAENAKTAVDTFLDSLIIQVVFMVPTEDRKTLKWHRTCSRDNMTGMTTYAEQKYTTD